VHGDLPGRDIAGQHSSDAVTFGGQSLTDYLTGLKVFHPDVAFHPVNTSGAYPESDIDPINDTAAWVTAGGPAFFNVSTGDVVAINNTDFDPTTTGIYNWNGTTFTRHPDYVTTASLDTLLVISDVHHSHFSGVPLATAIPLAAMFFADDIDAPLGTAEFVTKIFPDGDTVIDLITYLGGGTVTTSDITGVATARILGRTTAGTGTAEELTASAVRTLLSLVVGTDVQAYDAELAAIAGLTSAADKLPYFTGSGTAALADLSSFIRTYSFKPATNPNVLNGGHLFTYGVTAESIDAIVTSTDHWNSEAVRNGMMALKPGGKFYLCVAGIFTPAHRAFLTQAGVAYEDTIDHQDQILIGRKSGGA